MMEKGNERKKGRQGLWMRERGRRGRGCRKSEESGLSHCVCAVCAVCRFSALPACLHVTRAASATPSLSLPLSLFFLFLFPVQSIQPAQLSPFSLSSLSSPFFSCCTAMGPTIIESRKPQYLTAECISCNTPVEFLMPQTSGEVIYIECYACKQVLSIDIQYPQKGPASASSSSTKAGSSSSSKKDGTAAAKPRRTGTGTGMKSFLSLIYLFAFSPDWPFRDNTPDR